MRLLTRGAAALAAVLVFTFGATLGGTAVAAAPVPVQAGFDTPSDVTDVEPIVTDATDDTTPNITVNTAWLGVAVGSVLPLLVAALSKPGVHSGWQGVLNLVLSGLTAVGTEFVDNGGTLPIHQVVGAFLLVWGTSQLVYMGLWKPTRIAAKLANGPGLIGPAAPVA